MERKNYMMDVKDLTALQMRIPFVSEATLVRAGIKAALKLSKEELNELCLKAIARAGRPRIAKDENLKEVENG